MSVASHRRLSRLAVGTGAGILWGLLPPLVYDDAKLLADGNIHPDVITFLRQRGQDIVDVFQYSLSGSPD